MKQEDAKREIIKLWEKRKKGEHKRIDVLGFYGELENKHPDLLEFKERGDKYQKMVSVPV